MLPLVWQTEDIFTKEGGDYSRYKPGSQKAIAQAAQTAVTIKSVLDTLILTAEDCLTEESEKTAIAIEMEIYLNQCSIKERFMSDNTHDSDSSYNPMFDSIKGLKFYPYVGKNYKSAKPKILVVGESHYVKKTNQEGYKEANCINEVKIPQNDTIDAIEKSVLKKSGNKIKYFDLVGEALSVCQGGNPWESIAFMNKIQWMMSKASGDEEVKKRLNPQNHECQEDNHVFFSVVKALRPDIVIFFSRKAYESLPYYNDSDKFNKMLLELPVNVESIQGEVIESSWTPIYGKKTRGNYQYTYKIKNEQNHYIVPVYSYIHLTGGRPDKTYLNRIHEDISKLLNGLKDYE